MKLPNGYGSVTKLSGNRRKPYLARVTLGWITDEQTGKTVQNRVPLGTFKTKKEALQALAEYGANPYDIQNGPQPTSLPWKVNHPAVPSSQRGVTATPLPGCVLRTCVPATSRA